MINSIGAVMETAFEAIPVECYSGYKLNERPAAFTWQGQRRDVAEIVDRWYEGGIRPDRPVMDYFRVRTTDGGVFVLRYDTSSDQWSILIQT